MEQANELFNNAIDVFYSEMGCGAITGNMMKMNPSAREIAECIADRESAVFLNQIGELLDNGRTSEAINMWSHGETGTIGRYVVARMSELAENKIGSRYDAIRAAVKWINKNVGE